MGIPILTKPQNASLPQRSHRGQGNLTASGMGLGHAATHCSTPCGWEAGPCGGCSHWRGRVLPRSVKKARSHDSKSSKHMRKSTNTCEKAPAFWNAKVLSSVPRLELVNLARTAQLSTSELPAGNLGRGTHHVLLRCIPHLMRSCEDVFAGLDSQSHAQICGTPNPFATAFSALRLRGSRLSQATQYLERLGSQAI